MPETWLRVPSSSIIATRERRGWIDCPVPSLRVSRTGWTGPLVASACRGLGEGAKERFGGIQTPDGALLLRVGWSSELWYSLVDDLGGASVAGDLDRLQVTWLHLGSWAPYPMCRALYSEVRAPVWQRRHASALLSPKGEERQALTSGVP